MQREVVEQPPVDLAINADTSDPVQTASVIVERFGLTPQALAERYPPPEGPSGT